METKFNVDQNVIVEENFSEGRDANAGIIGEIRVERDGIKYMVYLNSGHDVWVDEYDIFENVEVYRKHKIEMLDDECGDLKVVWDELEESKKQ